MSLSNAKDWFGVLVLVGIVAVGLVCSSSKAQERAEFIVQVGEQEEVFKPYSFGLTDFPDGLMGVLKKDGVYYWFIGSFPPGYNSEKDEPRTYLFRFVGNDLNKMRPDPIDKKGNAVAVLYPGLKGSYDDHIAGNGSVYFDEKSGRLYFWWQAMQELPKEIAERKCEKLSEEEVYPAYSTIGSAVSEDMGKTWEKLGGALKFNLTWDAFIKDDSIGYADSYPPAVVRNGEYLHMYYVDYQPPPNYSYWNLAVARLHINDLDKTPQLWKKYYNGEFTEPAMGGKFTSINSEGAIEFPAVSFDTYLKRWIMLHVSWDENSVWEIALRTSGDGISWSEPQAILRSSNPRDQVMSPIIIGTGDNPSLTGQEFWLYYSYAPNEREYPPGGWLVRRSVHLENK